MKSFSTVSTAALLVFCLQAGGPAWAALGVQDAPVSQPLEKPTGVQPARPELQRRAEAGEAEAQYQLGVDYQFGLGGPADWPAARAWFGRAAAQGHVKGLGAHGYMLLSGSGGPQDLVGAEKALRQAGEGGEASATANLAELLLLRGEAAEARQMLARAVAGGALNARYRLGRLDIAEGRVPEGMALVEQAVERGHPEATLYFSGLLLAGGNGLKADPARAARLLRQAAEAGYGPATNDLARLYDLGIGVAADPRQAADLYRRALSQGTAIAGYNLGLLLNSQRLGPPDAASARSAYQLSAEAGFVPGMGKFGEMLLRGRGGPADPAGGIRWLTQAAEGGDADAQNHLAQIGRAHV